MSKYYIWFNGSRKDILEIDNDKLTGWRTADENYVAAIVHCSTAKIKELPAVGSYDPAFLTEISEQQFNVELLVSK